jgi:zinc transport system substrate-binding protein
MKELLLAATLLLLAAGCAPSESEARGARADAAPAGGPLVIYAVNHPLECLAARIGGDAVEVELPDLEGDPAFWSPDPETVARYQTADLVLLNGAGYASWTSRASLPASRTVDTSAGFGDRLIAEEGVVHTHGPGGEHEHGATAFTTWLDPTLALEHARAVLAALEQARPGRAEAFRERFAEVEAELRALDERLAGVVSADPDRPLLGSHPVYQYLARRYDLDLVSLHWEPDVDPGEAEWAALERRLEEHPARWMLWEGEPLEETRERLAALGVASVVFDPAGNRPNTGDFLEVMQANADALAEAYR